MPIKPMSLTICRDEDCPECGWPETYALGTIEAGPEWVGCRQCGWMAQVIRPPDVATGNTIPSAT